VKIYIEAQPDGSLQPGQNDYAETEHLALYLSGLHIYDTDSTIQLICVHNVLWYVSDLTTIDRSKHDGRSCEIRAKLASR
jgi:hypothetical protein